MRENAPMQLETLRFFCDAARLGSFSRAAEHHGVSQSAVSQAIQQLEERLGVQLVDRSRRPWVLTEEGKLYYERVRELLEGLDEVEARLRERARIRRTLVRVAAIYSVGLHDMGRYVAQLQEELPGSQVDLNYVHPNRVYELLEAGQADLGLVSFPSHSRELIVVPWRQEPMRLVCPPQHEWARRDAVPVAELDGQPLVAFERGLAIRRAIDRYLRQHGAKPRIVAAFDNVEMIKRAVEDGMGVAVLPEPTVAREQTQGTLTAVRFEGEPLHRPLCVVLRRGTRLNRVMVRFVEILTNRPWEEGRRRLERARARGQLAATSSPH